MIILIYKESSKAEEVIEYLKQAEIIVEVSGSMFNLFLASASLDELFREMFSCSRMLYGLMSLKLLIKLYMTFIPTRMYLSSD